ncbi:MULTISPECIES: hypothetical protein [Pseudoalteromonas]|uniref:ATP-binding protein n=1 Tax=Pseudoalteromonas maricaloris TaxID=184924 RepID=A0A8I2H7H7_9GAMM|nr:MULTISPECIES: hypothetical protein [Pseudoalteromonas]NLR22589.1 hypothetical protein [Pseudoalteromonas maricaloris]RZG14764.1 hypothetical protein EXT47_12720 [Pseudoalteromonas sp. CO342X]WOX29514.1 hypothetical protein R5H13_04415 [Pseudoalteromonas maricaloris]
MKKKQLPSIIQKNRWRRRLSSKRLKKAKRSEQYSLKLTRKGLRFVKSPVSIRVIAPFNISLGKKYHNSCVNFVTELGAAVRQASISLQTVCICFRDTEHISASAGIYLLSSTEEYVMKFPGVKFQVRVPPSVPLNSIKRREPVVHAALNRIGFYSVLSIKQSSLKPIPHVNTWHIESDKIVKGNLVGKALNKLESIGIDQKALYRSGIEAMNNAIEHAYSREIPNVNKFITKKWWLFAGVIDNKLIFLIADKGHGIPNTIPYTQPQNIIDEIKSKMKAVSSKVSDTVLTGDVEAIHVATLIKKTRTELGHRGKGGPDLRKFVESEPKAKLQIYSNFGSYSFSITSKGKSAPLGFNNKRSIQGTIIGWEVPLPEGMSQRA